MMNEYEVFKIDCRNIYKPLFELIDGYLSFKYSIDEKKRWKESMESISNYAHKVHTENIAVMIDQVLEDTEMAFWTKPEDRFFTDEILFRNKNLFEYIGLVAKYWTIFDWYNDPHISFVSYISIEDESFKLRYFKRYALRRMNEYTARGKEISSKAFFVDEWKYYLGVMAYEIKSAENYNIVKNIEHYSEK